MRLAIVTGGSRGLGRALCELYAARGWSVVEFSRTAPHPYSVALDLAEPLDAVEAFHRTLDRLGASSYREIVAFNNAAVIGPVGPVERLPAQGIANHIHINVVSAILFAHTFVEIFQAHDCPKTFVNVTSGAARRGVAGWSLYCASKAAAENLIRAIAEEQALRAHPVVAVSVSPGVMDTDMQTIIRGVPPEDFPTVGRFVGYKNEGLLSPPAEVAASIARIVAARPQAGGVFSA